MADSRILLVCQDQEGIDDILQAFLFCMPGYAVNTINSALKLKTSIQSLQPQLIILDLDIETADGFKLIDHVKSISRASVITLSYSRDESTVVRTLEHGADEHINKPIRQMEFIAHVKSLLRKNSEIFNK